MAQLQLISPYFYLDAIIGVVLILSVCVFLAVTTKRNRLTKLFPSRSFPFFCVWGDISIVPSGIYDDNYNGFSTTTHILQYVMGLCHLFKKASIFCVWLTYMPVIVLNTPEAIEEALSGTKALQKSWFYDWLHCWLGKGLLTSYGPKWQARRKLLTPAFHFDILKEFMPVMNEKSMVLVKKLKEETENIYTNIVPFITLCSLDIMCETALGVDINCQENRESDYVKAVTKVTFAVIRRAVSFLSWFDFTFFLTQGKAIKKELDMLHDFTMSIIRKKKQELLTNESVSQRKRKPLIDMLLEHQLQNKDITDEEIRGEVDTFAFEGHDTTAMAMVWTLYLLGLNPEDQDKVHQELDQIFGRDQETFVAQGDLKELKYLECAIKEALRLYPSIPIIGRRNEKEVDICGYNIPKGTTIIAVPYSLHRSEKYFPNPEIFDPTRFLPENSKNRHPFAYLPFSAGSRNCIGQRFAMIEMKTVLANVLRNFKVKSLDSRDKIPTSVEVVLRPSVEIRMKISARTFEH